MQVSLRSLSPDFTVCTQRMYGPILTFVTLAIIGTQLFRYIRNSPNLPEVLGLFALMFTASALWAVLVFLPELEIIIFKDRLGENAFQLIRESKQRTECDAFLAELIARIETPGRVLKTDDDQISLKARVLPNGECSVAGWYWKAAIIFSVCAIGLPWVPQLDDFLLGFLTPLVFACSTAGICFGILSYNSRESMRYVAIPAAIFSLVPWIFYT